MSRSKKILKSLASLRLAVILLLLLASAVAVGTFIESYHGPEASKLLVYRTPWFDALLILLAINLLTSAFSRWPWKKKHTGFLTVHLGIILILTGSLVSQIFGMEGSIPVPEGETAAKMALPDKSVIYIISSKTNQRWFYPVVQKALPWQGDEEMKPDSKAPFSAHLLRSYRKAKPIEKISEGPEGLLPALHIKLQGSFAQSDAWLLLDRPEKNSQLLGPLTVRFDREPIKEQKPLQKGLGILHLRMDASELLAFHIEEEKIGKRIAVPNTPYFVTINRVLHDAEIDGSQLKERSDQWLNPALQLTLEGEGGREYHTCFSKFKDVPDFPTLHGLKTSQTGIRVSYEGPEDPEAAPKNELRFIYRPSALPLYQIQKKDGQKEGEVILNQEVQTGWMDLHFTIDQYVAHAKWEKNYEPLPGASASDDAKNVVMIRLSDHRDQKTLWLSEGELEQTELNGIHYDLAYGLQTKPLGFSLKLENFTIETDPGTNRPASFKSKVTLLDASRGVQSEHLIWMNHPLKYRGFKIYQSGYQILPNENKVSVFVAARDPGNWMKYCGTLIMLAGMIMLFFISPFSTLKSSDPKLRMPIG